MVYTKTPLTPNMVDILVNILTELSTVVTLTTKHIKEGQLSASIPASNCLLTYLATEKCVKKLLGKNDIGVMLQRLDILAQEEACATAAQTLGAAYGLAKNMKVVAEGIAQLYRRTSGTQRFRWEGLDRRYQTGFGWVHLSDIHDEKGVKRLLAVATQQTANEMSKMNRLCSFGSLVDAERCFTGNQLRRELRRWLSPPDPSINHNLARKVQHSGTATWFTESNLFKQWRSTSSLLWICGKRTRNPSTLSTLLLLTIPVTSAGSGKSVLWYVTLPPSSSGYSHPVA
jgi:hypothetical protein